MQENTFGGTWVTYFIENNYLNIFITGDENVSNDWNFDWKVVNFDESQMEIENGTDRFLLTKECYEPCRKILLKNVKQTNSGSAVFDLESYFECFFPFSALNPSIVT